MPTSTETVLDKFEKPPFYKSLGVHGWVWALLIFLSGGQLFMRYSAQMETFDQGILIGALITLLIAGWAWRPICTLSLIVTALAISAITLYKGDIANAEQVFGLQYLISSQSAIMWMSALYVMATLAYLFALIASSQFTNRVASFMTWGATAMGLVGFMVRWYESYLLGPDIGHIPVSNLYEVFILFAVIMGLLYLYYEDRFRTYTMGVFALAMISASVGFILWYTFGRGGTEIQPLVPALQSYWMKIHVPANFIGYGSFSLAAMFGAAYLLRTSVARRNPQSAWLSRLPELDLLDDVMHKAIALGFAFFTVATVLGAFWAAEAWGNYWSWDPKETWALIVWLNYAAWMHMRLSKGWRGTPLAWWAMIGLLVTLFAFLGVNMFLSGLHSYGEL